MNNFNSNYVGIVIQNNDPEKRGRIKVFIPHISASIYEKWYQPENNDVKDKKFKFLGAEGGVDTALTRDILDELKEVVPWAECASPLGGADGAGRYNAFNDVGSISDSSNVDDLKVGTNESESTTKLNEDNIGEAPGKLLEYQEFRLKDAFHSTSTRTGPNDPNRFNYLSYNYIPSTYSNKSKGSFSIPNVGAHVWVFFKEGDPMCPVYFAVSHGQEDWRGIYESNLDYPGSFENVSKKDIQDSNLDANTYRNKHVINQKGGTIEIVNTDNKETLKFTHFSGSFKEFNNHANIELASKNDQKLVLEDQFLTVRGFRNIFTEKDVDDIVKGNRFIKVGNLDRDVHLEWRETVRELALIKQLFEIQRTENVHSDVDEVNGILPFRKTSNLQKQTGSFAPCPVCSDPEFADYYWRVNNAFNKVDVTTTNSSSNEATTFSSTSYSITPSQYKQEQQSGTIYNDTCPVCLGSGVSPSSMNGSWAVEPEKEKFSETIKRVAEKLIDIEKRLGNGGSEIVNVAKHKTEIVGLVMNDFGSVRVDPVGKMYRNEVVIHPEGTFNSQKATPLVEYVHVDDLPGGTYNLNVCNKFNILVGAGGINLRSYGPVDIGGTITNIVGEQVNIASQNEVNISGSKRTTITGDVVTLRQTNRGQVLVDSNLGCSQNVIIGGGLYAEGETYLQHVTAPVEIQETELVRLFGKLLQGLSFRAEISESSLTGRVTSKEYGNAIKVAGGCRITLTGDSNDNNVRMYDHSHNFKNLPLTLKNTNEGVRIAASGCNEVKRVMPDTIAKTPASQKSK